MKKIIGIIGGLALAVFTFTVGSNTLTSSDITLSNLVNMDVAKAFDGEYDDIVRYDERVVNYHFTYVIEPVENTWPNAVLIQYLTEMLVTCEGTGDVGCDPALIRFDIEDAPIFSTRPYWL